MALDSGRYRSIRFDYSPSRLSNGGVGYSQRGRSSNRGNRNGSEWATDYLSAPVCDWSAEEIDFIDWVFNSSAVLRERANLMDQHEGLTYERDAVRREPFALRSSYFVNELTDDLSTTMVKKIQNRYGVEIWPWERAGFTRAR